jgi:hypothetical protein
MWTVHGKCRWDFRTPSEPDCLIDSSSSKSEKNNVGYLYATMTHAVSSRTSSICLAVHFGDEVDLLQFTFNIIRHNSFAARLL